MSYELQLKAAEDEMATFVAALDAIEEALFGENYRRSRDEIVDEAERLREENERLREALGFVMRHYEVPDQALTDEQRAALKKDEA